MEDVVPARGICGFARVYYMDTSIQACIETDLQTHLNTNVQLENANVQMTVRKDRHPHKCTLAQTQMQLCM